VRVGGKIAVVCDLEISAIRAALKGPAAIKGDWAKALKWADVYISCRAAGEDLEALDLIALDRPEHVGKLAAVASSFLTISHANRTLAHAAE
jgi:hypothetical protein